VVEVNLSHPFSKAVFEVSHAEITSVPRRATNAVQQLLYILGYCEFTMVGEDENDDDARMFEQYRRYVSMNIEALLD
jgi:long-subunit acyl-CoA synthetase (AMP-forming)